MKVKSLINITYRGKIFEEGLVYTLDDKEKDIMEKEILKSSTYINKVFKILPEINQKIFEQNGEIEQDITEEELLRIKYEEKFGKKPHPKMSLEKLKNKLGV